MTERSVTWSQRLMLCIIGRHVPPLSQNQTDKVLVYFWGPDGECGRTLRVYFWVPRLKATRTSAFPHSKQINLGLLWGPRFESKQIINILNYLPRRMPLLPFRWKDAPGLLLGTQIGATGEHEESIV